MSQIPLDSMQPVVTGNVDADIPCRKCGYNLRGLAVDGRCPECATPVGVSINGELLRYSDPTFVIGLIVIIYTIMYLIMLFRFGRQFEEQTRLAQAAWSKAHPAT
jgi:hypothetical protein